MNLSRYREGDIIIAPEGEKPVLSCLSENGVSVYSTGDVEAFFRFEAAEEAVVFLQKRGYENAKILLEDLRHMMGDSYRSELLQSFVPIAQEMERLGLLIRPSIDPRDVFCNKNILIRGYYSGERLSYALQDLPNICLNWDLGGNSPLSDKPLEVKSVSNCSELLQRLLDKKTDLLGVRNDSNKALPRCLQGLPLLEGPYIPADKEVIEVVPSSSFVEAEHYFDDACLGELRIPTNAMAKKWWAYDENCFTRNKRLILRLDLR